MMLIFFDEAQRGDFFPLTLTRPIADLRIGILKISEKWQQYFKADCAFKTASYLNTKFPFKTGSKNIFINGTVCPDAELVAAIDGLKEGESLIKDKLLLAVKLNETDAKVFSETKLEKYRSVPYSAEILNIQFVEDIFQKNNIALNADFELITKGRTSANLSSTNTIIGNQIFVEEGVEAECSTFNSQSGPIYLGKNSQVWEGTNIRGSLALCNDSQIKMGGKIYGATTIGPHSRVGGEISNAVIWGYSSKGHDGFLGNSVLGEWCNLGADSNNSNLKNNYAEVKLWSYEAQKFRKTGLQFCGLIIGDHSKCSINTMFNTGTVVGVSANIFGTGFPRNFVPDFSWGGAHGYEVYSLIKMFETANMVYPRRNRVFNDEEKAILAHIFEITEKFRRF
jgi:UDP-N-acetylglucosamine diphosphorylase/glucosamine-1-phosphate N-acetyltransferase